ncbi:MAG: SAM-dependent methyltransferase [Methanobacterium sp. BRmetb2]|nr:MAG: SAM-dependent methyltransferase [Methanobacterium sp. BRmetb2]
MANKTGIAPSNKHRIQGRTSESFIDARDVVSRLNLKGNEVFMDAGCGDGHVAMIAHEMMGDDATIYALDIYEPSIEDMENEIEEKGIKNIIPIQTNIAEEIDLPDNTVNIILMINVFHGLMVQGNIDETITELKRIVKPGGKIAIMDYKKMDVKHGPPLHARRSPEELEEMFKRNGLKKIKVDNEIGEDLENGLKSHYLIIFRK